MGVVAVMTGTQP
jgi:hypothetical protein